jgi:DNA-binding transcriptional regulator YdaS (Cro superfamily)
MIRRMTLHDYLRRLSKTDRAEFAVAAGTVLGHLHNISYGYKPCTPRIAVGIERESRGVLRVEELCPDVDWAVIRGRKARRKQPTRRHG